VKLSRSAKGRRRKTLTVRGQGPLIDKYLDLTVKLPLEFMKKDDSIYLLQYITSVVHFNSECGDWIKVKITVNSNQIDVYIEGVQVMHYLLGTVGLPVNTQYVQKLDDGTEKQITFTQNMLLGNYNVGGVGFRCAGQEHAHFRNVRVKPL